jgi:phage-related protein
MKPKFEIELLPEAVEFLDQLNEKAREKVYYNMKKAQFVNDNELFKKLNTCIWEFRTLYNGKSYRLFSFWERRGEQYTLVVATHGVLKKTQKTPAKEINKAEEIRKKYLELKSKNN